MTTNQLSVLAADILADPTLNGAPHNSDGATTIQAAYRALAAPAFTVWKSNVSITQIGDNIVSTEMAGLTTVNATRLQTIVMLSQNGINPSLADRRAFFDDIFSGSGGTLTRPKLLALYKRFATRLEKLYATGTGSDASPATLVIEGDVSVQDVMSARGDA